MEFIEEFEAEVDDLMVSGECGWDIEDCSFDYDYGEISGTHDPGSIATLGFVTIASATNEDGVEVPITTSLKKDVETELEKNAEGIPNRAYEWAREIEGERKADEHESRQFELMR